MRGLGLVVAAVVGLLALVAVEAQAQQWTRVCGPDGCRWVLVDRPAVVKTRRSGWVSYAPQIYAGPALVEGPPAIVENPPPVAAIAAPVVSAPRWRGLFRRPRVR